MAKRKKKAKTKKGIILGSGLIMLLILLTIVNIMIEFSDNVFDRYGVLWLIMIGIVIFFLFGILLIYFNRRG